MTPANFSKALFLRKLTIEATVVTENSTIMHAYAAGLL
eukprot:CAMPEP_0177403212 /NCGR_PEP_ID=MMETSP0368-20130122/60699_1 /TAXON_ID=447022 ORGANISM="Scrippsiella hangoei-like, Strain SHHI-4" /NCGR_SAMPLE_ID=MMETSP0368 /ASSEMBLY_ACC=CAM_ASM_000363 /LENGTH=37 /DNA_ID= /DNA_START= /DNA_END= /DNA_ORIENTATION=